MQRFEQFLHFLKPKNEWGKIAWAIPILAALTFSQSNKEQRLDASEEIYRSKDLQKIVYENRDHSKTTIQFASNELKPISLKGKLLSVRFEDRYILVATKDPSEKCVMTVIDGSQIVLHIDGMVDPEHFNELNEKRIRYDIHRNGAVLPYTFNRDSKQTLGNSPSQVGPDIQNKC